jgi:hypothetical protein
MNFVLEIDLKPKVDHPCLWMVVSKKLPGIFVDLRIEKIDVRKGQQIGPSSVQLHPSQTKTVN